MFGSSANTCSAAVVSGTVPVAVVYAREESSGQDRPSPCSDAGYSLWWEKRDSKQVKVTNSQVAIRAVKGMHGYGATGPLIYCW